MIRFNRIGRNTKLANNWFYDVLPNTRKTLFKRALGLLPDKHPVLRKLADGSTHDYQEPLTESRQYVTRVFQDVAISLGVQTSQVIHAFQTGRKDKLVEAIQRKLGKKGQVEFIKTAKGSMRSDVLIETPKGHIWKGDFSKIDREQVEKSVEDIWMATAGLMTERERAAEGGSEALAKLDAANRAKARSWTTSKKNSMQGVKVVNNRKAAREAVATGVQA